MNKEQADVFRQELEDLLNKHRVSISGDIDGDMITSPLKERERVSVQNLGGNTYLGKPTGWWAFDSCLFRVDDEKAKG